MQNTEQIASWPPKAVHRDASVTTVKNELLTYEFKQYLQSSSRNDMLKKQDSPQKIIVAELRGTRPIWSIAYVTKR